MRDGAAGRKPHWRGDRIRRRFASARAVPVATTAIAMHLAWSWRCCGRGGGPQLVGPAWAVNSNARKDMIQFTPSRQLGVGDESVLPHTTAWSTRTPSLRPFFKDLR